MSLLLHPDEFREKYDGEELEAQLADRPITSVRDIQYLYGQLYTLATAGESEYAAYLTPGQAQDLLGEPESLVSLRVDLADDKPKLADDPIDVAAYEEDDIPAVAHCKYDSARGIDHSVTHRSGRDKAPEDIVGYAKERLTRWATDDVVRSVAEDHEDGWIIKALAALGDDESVAEAINDAVDAKLEGSTTALITVQVRLNDDDEYRYPGELDTDVFNAAMRSRQLSKLVSKGAASDSTGDAVDLLTGEERQTVGTAEDPLNYYLGKQLEKFPGLDPDEAWRTHPVSEDAAVTLINAETFVEACTYSSFGATVYYLPYFMGVPDGEQSHQLYATLYSMVEDTGDMTPVERAYKALDIGDAISRGEHPSLRFYVAAIQKHQAKRFDVFGDTLDARLLWPVEISEAHSDVLRSWIFNESWTRNGTTPPMPSNESWDLTQPHDFLPSISSGNYFYETFASGDDDTDASADDPRLQALVSILAGEPISADVLLEQYVSNLMDSQGDQFPSFQVAAQFAQLCALASNGLIAATDRTELIAQPPDYDATQTMPESHSSVRADGGFESSAAARHYKLEQFIDQTPALDDDTERGVERQGAFLIGVLVGQVGSYQQVSEDRSTTLIDQYPIKAMTKTKVKRIVEETLDKNIVYSRENGQASTMYAEVVDELRNALARRDPDRWEINLDDLRFYYALGVTYGMNDWTDNETEDATDAE